jgi:prepilin-type N-terminal cleavage/methylation domain-containing protein
MSDQKIPRKRSSRRTKLHASNGMGLIELMIAMTVLTVGMLGSMIMIITGMESNTRNKRDNGATILDQEILETFATYNNYPNSGYVTIADCNLSGSNLHEASVIQASYAAGGAGATLLTSSTASGGTAIGDIDWSQATPTLATSSTPGYAMLYQTCGGEIYEVRWNVMDANSTIPTISTGYVSRLSLLTVSSRLTTNKNGTNGMLFALPTTLRTMIESSSY